MRPDENPVLIAIGSGEEACDKCMTELHPNEDDSICNGCKLSPAKSGEMKEFMEKSVKREFSLPVKEVLKRHEIMNK